MIHSYWNFIALAGVVTQPFAVVLPQSPKDQVLRDSCGKRWLDRPPDRLFRRFRGVSSMALQPSGRIIGSGFGNRLLELRG